MSGGAFNYEESHFASLVYDGVIIPRYTQDVFTASKEAREKGPFEDRVFNELLWDMLCMMHAYDLCVSGDTNEEEWNDVKKKFHDKWGLPSKKYQEAFIEDEYKRVLAEFKEELDSLKGVEDK